MLYPLLTETFTALFAWGVWIDFVERRRPHQALWLSALVFSMFAAGAYALALQFESAIAFRVYYLCGALLAGAYMGMGSLYLVLKRRTAHFILIILIAASLIGAILLFLAPIDQTALAHLAGGSGTGVLLPGLWQLPVILLNVFGAIAAVGVALASAWKAMRRTNSTLFMWGNLLIAIGITVVSMAGSTAKWIPHWDGSFWVTMTSGWAIAFLGFRVITQAIELGRKQPTPTPLVNHNQ